MVTPTANLTDRPRIRPVLRAANLIGSGLRRCRLPAGDLSEDIILGKAARQTGLTDLGDERFRVPLRALLESYESDPELTFVGRMIARGMLIHLAANRLRIHRDLRQHPEILDAAARRPLFVVGLPRSGTTLLYNLLAQDPAARPLLMWESMQPSAPPGCHNRQSDPRIKQAVRTIGQLNRAVPGLSKIHEMDPRAPEECLGLLMNTFVTPFFRGRLPRYRQWLYAIGDDELQAAYREYRQQLLLLQWQHGGEHWLLKCPSHLFGLGALMAVFPDACIVQTHRDPAEAVPSLCSLSAALDGLSYARVDRGEVGRRTVEIVGQLVDRSMKARQGKHTACVCDVHYRELVRDPAGTVQRLYRHFGYAYSGEIEKRIAKYLADHPRHKHGVHAYRLEDFGLEREAVQARFAAYCRQFGINAE